MTGQLVLLPSPDPTASPAREQFGALTEREREIYRLGFANGMHRANNAVQPTVSDLELRISKAIEALSTPSF